MSKLLTAAEVAERLNLRKGRVYELARMGILPKVCTGPRQLRFAEDQINAWIANGGQVLNSPNAQNRSPLTPFRR